jgi:hypothetical protein
MKFRIARKLNYLKKARHRYGHGIHSPFLFRLITKVIENKKQHSAYKILREQRDRLSNLIKDNRDQLEIQTLSDSILISSGRKNLFKAVELPLRYGKLLFRLISEFKPKSISYYGPSFGMNILYLALPDENIPVNIFQSENSLGQFGNETFKEQGITNVCIHDPEVLIDHTEEFVFINFPFSPNETDKYIKKKLDVTCNNDVMIIRSIHESAQMESIWKEIIKSERVRVSLDIFEIGIVLFKTNLQKEHFILRF